MHASFTVLKELFLSIMLLLSLNSWASSLYF